MEEQLVKVLCKLISFSYDYFTDMANSTLIVDKFLQEANLELSPIGKQKLIDTFNKIY